MTEKDVIFAKINIIKNCLGAIDKEIQRPVEQIDEVVRENIYTLNLQRAIQACIDCANTIIAHEGLGLPSTYRQSFDLLFKAGIVDKSLTVKMQKMVGFRNIAVHEYQEINLTILASIVQHHLHDFPDFYQIIYQHIQSWP